MIEEYKTWWSNEKKKIGLLKEMESSKMYECLEHQNWQNKTFPKSHICKGLTGSNGMETHPNSMNCKRP